MMRLWRSTRRLRSRGSSPLGAWCSRLTHGPLTPAIPVRLRAPQPKNCETSEGSALAHRRSGKPPPAKPSLVSRPNLEEHRLAVTLAPNVYYAEDELVEGLGISKKFLRRKVGGLRAGHRRVYRGAEILEAMQPCQVSASVSTSAPAPRFGGPSVTSRARVGGPIGGAPGSELPREASGSLVARLRDERRSMPSVSPLAPRPPRRADKPRSSR